MPHSTTPVVTSDAYLTLHYRLVSSDGNEIISTFSNSPATLQLGSGQLAPELESALLGLEEGSHTILELAAGNAFGPRNPDLVQQVSLETLQENSVYGEKYVVGDLVEFSAPGGGQFAGILRAFNESGALFDFNHPLAGQAITFEVKIIGIL
ncbi:FKBP-type peptidyl-prolyl cis-trans isomerase [Undibacterium sp.]|uniref:FKBP-type peptidyl-prolyl cis-trans isomerase n=1 Tax=Undibacterium sp. TaxID=1914977 RepID=UPI0025F96AFF|nr:FKBP-type peptidyl-prolyl cis-trans isomerase [Undibacterium sp.]MCX7219572.1 FKBP-type peptidyl-prolyl cis-trans isomerase [Burkholderiales bacterium]